MLTTEFNHMLSVETDDLPGVKIIHIVGECDSNTCPALSAELRNASIAGRDVILDAHLLTYIDGDGVGSIVSAHEALVQNKRQLRIVGAHGTFSRILRLMQGDAEIPMHETVDDAIRNLANGKNAH